MEEENLAGEGARVNGKAHEVTPDVVNSELEGYVVTGAIGIDPFGSQFNAVQEKFKRAVCVRLLPVASSDYPGGFPAFSDYMAGLSQFHHANIAQVLDFGESTHGRLYIVSEACNRTADRGFESKDEIATVFRQAGPVLDWLHANGMVHGWIHPSVVGISDEGQLKLVGIGMAGIAAAIAEPLDLQAVIPFLAPENAGRIGDSPAADIYGLGATLYAVLTGSVPIGVFKVPSESAPRFGVDFDAAILGTLQADPGARFPCGEAFAGAIGAKPVAPRSAASVPTKPIASIPNPQTPSTRPPAYRPPASQPSSFPWPAVLVVLTLVIVAASILAFLRDAPEETTKKETTIAANEEEAKSRREKSERRSRIESKLTLLTQISLFCPEVEVEAIRAGMGFWMTLTASGRFGEILDSTRGKEFGATLTPQFEKRVDGLIANARLPKPTRPFKRGLVTVWGPKAESKARGQVALPDYRGSDEGVVAIGGTPVSGVALHHDGKVSSWGQGAAPPEGIAAVASVAHGEEGLIAALHEDGTVTVWGRETAGLDSVATWRDVARIAVGQRHVVAVTRDFRVLAAGDSSKNQTQLPTGIEKKHIVRVAASGNSCYALGADGQVHVWGGGLRKASVSSVLWPSDIRTTGGRVFVRDQGGYVHGVTNRAAISLELFGLDDPRITIPRYSMIGDLFAYRRKSSWWTLAGQSAAGVDAAFWQESARGAIDILLTPDRFVGLIAGVATRDEVTPFDEPEEAVPIEVIDGLRIPVSHTYRAWQLKDGSKGRLRFAELKDGKSVKLRSSTGRDHSRPLEAFSEADQKFLRDCETLDTLNGRRLAARLGTMEGGTFLAELGFESIDLIIGANGRLIVASKVNGLLARFLVDTGASGTSLDLELATRAGIKRGAPVPVTTWQSVITGFEGSINRLTLGNVDLDDVPIVSADLGQAGDFDGILGMDVLRNLDAVLDFHTERLLIRRHGAKEEVGDEDNPVEVRMWTDASIEGRFIKRDHDGSVTLSDPEGTRMLVPVNDLNERDLEYLDLHALHIDFEKWFRRELKNHSYADLLGRHRSEWADVGGRMASAMLYVDVAVDGREFQFFVDTGAAISKLSIKSANEIGKQLSELRVIGSSGGLGGGMKRLYEGTFDKFQIGPRSMSEHRVRVYDFDHVVRSRRSGSPPDGVLGTDVLGEVRAVIDLNSRKVVVRRDK